MGFNSNISYAEAVLMDIFFCDSLVQSSSTSPEVGFASSLSVVLRIFLKMLLGVDRKVALPTYQVAHSSLI
jgi:hypothetical protein